jgi:hypothetical protein
MPENRVKGKLVCSGKGQCVRRMIRGMLLGDPAEEDQGDSRSKGKRDQGEVTSRNSARLYCMLRNRQ